MIYFQNTLTSLQILIIDSVTASFRTPPVSQVMQRSKGAQTVRSGFLHNSSFPSLFFSIYQLFERSNLRAIYKVMWVRPNKRQWCQLKKDDRFILSLSFILNIWDITIRWVRTHHYLPQIEILNTWGIFSVKSWFTLCLLEKIFTSNLLPLEVLLIKIKYNFLHLTNI